MKKCNLSLRGLLAPVRLSGAGWKEADFAPFLPTWPFEITAISDERPFASITKEDGKYVFASDFGDGPVVHASLVNSVCDMIAHAARQRTLERQGDMCLHASAVRIGNGLAVMPATRRAGKSIMTAALAAHGHAVFSDDVLPITAKPGEPMFGQATGAAIRLRLPIPKALPDWLHEHVAKYGGPLNRQYQYLLSPQLANNGISLPLLALVSLEYVEGVSASLAPMPRGKMLKALFKQNFARETAAENILLALLTLASKLPSFHLMYSDVDEAVALLSDRLSKLQVASLTMPYLPEAQPIEIDRAGFSPDLPLLRRKGATVIDLDGEAFAVSADQRNVVHLDYGARRLWSLFDQPTCEIDAVEILTAAFPDVSAARIQSETSQILRRFGRAGLVVPAEALGT